MKFLERFDDLDKQVINPPSGWTEGQAQFWVSDNAGNMFRSIEHSITFHALQGFSDPNFVFQPYIPTRVIQSYLASNYYTIVPRFTTGAAALMFEALDQNGNNCTANVTWSASPSATFTPGPSSTYVSFTDSGSGTYTISVLDSQGNSGKGLVIDLF